MMENDETTAKDLDKILSEHGHHVSDWTALKCCTAWMDTSQWCLLPNDLRCEQRIRDYLGHGSSFRTGESINGIPSLSYHIATQLRIMA